MLKRSLGQYYTIDDLWLKKQIEDFIEEINPDIAFDPFAGEGHLLDVASKLGIKEVVGLDKNRELDWNYNDSLKKIPEIENSIIITNPPYLTNYSAKRRKIYDSVGEYFLSSEYDDLYKIALEKCLENNKYVIAIIPETFINSKFPKNRLRHITILEENPFEDTEKPVCVVCFDDKLKDYKEIDIYKNEEYIGNLKKIDSFRISPNNNIDIDFNNKEGKLALRAVDTTNPQKKIKFMRVEELDYDLENIKVSSRLITVINIDENLSKKELLQLIEKANKFVKKLRRETEDVILSPFKGNDKNGKRRRRLDYRTARAILEKAYSEVKNSDKKTLFSSI